MRTLLNFRGIQIPIWENFIVGTATSPFISAYSLNSSSFGVKYSDPSTLPTGNSATRSRRSIISPSSKYVAVGTSGTSPRIHAYRWSGNGFGTKFSNPSTIPSSEGHDIAFTNNEDFLAVAALTGVGNLLVYPWSDSGFGTAYTRPTFAGGSALSVAFSQTGSALLIGFDASIFIRAYAWSAGWGTQYANPGTAHSGSTLTVGFSKDNTLAYATSTVTPFLSVYDWSDSTGFGSRYANPGTLPASQCRGIHMSNNQDVIFVSHLNSPYIGAYAWSSSGFGTKFSDPSTLPAGNGFSVTLSRSQKIVLMTHNISPWLSAYIWSSSGFGTKFSNPSTLPSSADVYNASAGIGTHK